MLPPGGGVAAAWTRRSLGTAWKQIAHGVQHTLTAQACQTTLAAIRFLPSCLEQHFVLSFRGADAVQTHYKPGPH